MIEVLRAFSMFSQRLDGICGVNVKDKTCDYEVNDYDFRNARRVTGVSTYGGCKIKKLKYA